MTSNTAAVRPNRILQHEGMRWKPRPGTASTADDFKVARATFREIAADMRWNPWVREDRATEWEHATRVMGDWERAEPGHRYLTETEIEARWENSNKELRTQRDERQQRFERERAYYDPDRALARLRLIELHSRLQHDQAELAGLRNRTRFPAMAEERRTEQVVALEDTVVARKSEIATLEAMVGDPEAVVDEHGHRPRDRREIMLDLYALHRTTRVRELRAQLPDLRVQLDAADGKAQRAKRRRALDAATAELAALLAIAPLTADDMCSECATPRADHGWVFRQTAGPCPAWPQWAAKIRDVRSMMERAAQREQPAAEPAPTPQPLAVIRSGLPIAEVIVKLEQLQQVYPDAEVRRGRSGRIELWPRERNSDA